MTTLADLLSDIDHLLALTPDEQRAHLESRFSGAPPATPRLLIGLSGPASTLSSTLLDRPTSSTPVAAVLKP